MLSLAIKEKMEISLLGEPRLVGGVSSVFEGILYGHTAVHIVKSALRRSMFSQWWNY